MYTPEAADLLYRELQKIAAHPNWGAAEKMLALSGLLERLLVDVLRQEQLVFSTIFARLSYVGHKYNIQPGTLRSLHRLRFIGKSLHRANHADETIFQHCLRAMAELVLILSNAALPGDLIAYFPEENTEQTPAATELLTFTQKARVVAQADDPANHCLIAIDEEYPDKPVRVRYNLPERNENFNPTIKIIRQVFGFPVTLNLLEVDITLDGEYRPRVFVVEPDYLVDVSAVSESFKDTGPDPYAFLVKKFLPYETTEPILIGNIANFFLDRLLHEPHTEWTSLFRETFRLYPFAYAPMNDSQLRSISGKAQKHYLNLKNMASGALEKEGIAPADCILEPAFFSEQYGLQGRLDLFYQTENKAAIVELKSGTPFKPNSYGIQRSHFTQTLLYDLLVRSVFGQRTDPAKYILYSGVDINQLRFAPTVAPEQWEAIQVRNQIVAIERLLTKIKPGDEHAPVLARLRAANGAGFLQRDYGLFEGAYYQLNPLEKKYFNAFSGFIAREHWLAKIGDEASENNYGGAALWRSSYEDKELSFNILSHLEITDNRADQPDPVIIFRKTELTNPLANFRTGDIAVLYPAFDESDNALHHQVIKCTITVLERDYVTVQLRYRQFNLKPFDTEGYWNLEPDLMDIGFASMYRGLFEWAGSSPNKRRLLLGQDAPRQNPEIPNPTTSPKLSPEQAEIFKQIVRSKDYFLLWGPPGTGKTSVMLHALAAWTLHDTDDNLLILAYTNRAVDEICAAIDEIGGNIRELYLRLGSRHATGEPYRPLLLNEKIAGAENRADLKKVLDQHRIFVSTVASFSQNQHLLKLKKFQRLIIDEASQILEPQLVGLLTHFDHFLLIGDHRQLPAVTVQPLESTRVEDPDLLQISLCDLRDSYFERLYRRCEEQGWTWALSRLSHQGRMHADIMDFPNRFFYNDYLKTLALDQAAKHPQHQPLWYDLPGFDPEMERNMADKRVVFWPTPAEHNIRPGQKTSPAEAAQVVRLVQFFKKLFAANGHDWRAAHSLGIITPWRAQIAQIRAGLMEAGLNPDELSIDTVERYQGGARDVIIISTCVHTENQLQSLVNLSTEGVDRKLNVALTRARQHVIVLGNRELLLKDERYKAFVEAYEIDEFIG